MGEFEYKSGNYLFKLDEEHSIITVFKNEREISSIQNNHKGRIHATGTTLNHELCEIIL